MSGHTAIYGLSGDPITNGHLRVIRYGHQNFDKLYVVLADNFAKKYTFPCHDRWEMLREVVKGMENVEVCVLEPKRLLVSFAVEKAAHTLLRGIRNTVDHDYESMMAAFNEWLAPTIRTAYIGPEPGQPFVSSSFVKSLVGLEEWQSYVSKLVPPCVMPHLWSLAALRPGGNKQ